MGFEPTTPVFERSNSVHDLDLAAIVIGSRYCRFDISGDRFIRLALYEEPLFGVTRTVFYSADTIHERVGQLLLTEQSLLFKHATLLYTLCTGGYIIIQHILSS
jgi:hypothetical protein